MSGRQTAPIRRGAAGVLVAVAACGRPATPTPTSAAQVLVSVRAGTIAAPDSVRAGWTRVRVEEDGGGHIVVIFRLAESATDADLTAFLAALDTASATPRPAVALGGPEIGDTGEIVVQLTPGRYVLGCVRRGTDGHRHASTGEAKSVVVTEVSAASGSEVPPAATQEVGMVDFAYVGPERWPAGAHMLRVENRGQQEHQLRLVRLPPGATLRDWISAPDPGEVGTPLAGVARLGPGAVAYLPVELAAGEYVAYCLITDPASGQAHVELGMLRAIHVE